MGEGLGVRGKSAIVLGAGGSARAVTYALVKGGWRLTIAARRMEQAHQLESSFPNHKISIMDYSDIPLSTFHLLVNTTPAGMTPNTNQSPLPENIALPKDIMIYDLVYNPRETTLVKNAHAKGLSATTGLGMLIEQAALAFELWTGHNPPRNILYDSVVE
jgi:shikimate dehydrogenase